MNKVELMHTVAMNDFAAKRHTPEGKHSHFDGSFDELCSLVERRIRINNYITLVSDADGDIIKVSMPGDRFFSALTQAKPGMTINTTFDVREHADPGEYPFLNSRASGAEKLPATSAHIILYSHSRLAVKNEQSTDADWEIVSVNAERETGTDLPHPVTMLRNHRNYPGGTKTEYTLDQVFDAIEAWIGGGPNPPNIMLGG